ncbi:hypothetical protein RMATCC62417_12787 [Rhizopus microsporus]|nr:hypothetical protein RMATCC62417_12787 [Rhizopus microsporus]
MKRNSLHFRCDAGPWWNQSKSRLQGEWDDASFSKILQHAKVDTTAKRLPLPLIEFATSSSTNDPPKKKQRVMAADIQWCINNKDTFTLKSFADEFGLLDRLMQKSEAFKLYWLERSRIRTQLDVHIDCAEYVHDVVGRETRTLSSTVTATDTTTPTPTTAISSDTISSTADDTIRTTDVESETDADTAPTEVAADPLAEDVENMSPLTPWIFKDVDMAELFTRFRQAVNRMSSNHLFFIESSVHELLTLSNILLLCPGQHSPLCMNVFTEDVIPELNKELLSEIMDFNLDMTDDACMKLARIINNVESNIQSKDDAELDLLMLGKESSCTFRNQILVAQVRCSSRTKH